MPSHFYRYRKRNITPHVSTEVALAPDVSTEVTSLCREHGHFQLAKPQTRFTLVWLNHLQMINLPVFLPLERLIFFQLILLLYQQLPLYLLLFMTPVILMTVTQQQQILVRLFA